MFSAFVFGLVVLVLVVVCGGGGGGYVCVGRGSEITGITLKPPVTSYTMS